MELAENIKTIKNEIIGYEYVNYGGNQVNVMGYKDLLFFDEEKVILKVKNGEILVSGKNLQVLEVSHGFIIIKGEISSVTFS